MSKVRGAIQLGLGPAVELHNFTAKDGKSINVMVSDHVKGVDLSDYLRRKGITAQKMNDPRFGWDELPQISKNLRNQAGMDPQFSSALLYRAAKIDQIHSQIQKADNQLKMKSGMGLMDLNAGNIFISEGKVQFIDQGQVRWEPLKESSPPQLAPAPGRGELLRGAATFPPAKAQRGFGRPDFGMGGLRLGGLGVLGAARPLGGAYGLRAQEGGAFPQWELINALRQNYSPFGILDFGGRRQPAGYNYDHPAGYAGGYQGPGEFWNQFSPWGLSPLGLSPFPMFAY